MIAAALAMTLATGQWSLDKANNWAKEQRWSAGCNFIPSTAINQLEMWQPETFDPVTINREFGLMQQTGLSLARIFLHDLAYQADPHGFKNRMRRVLSLARAHHVRIMFVFFDDCWNPHSHLGKQADPRPGVHNSGWVRSPSDDRRSWPNDLEPLKKYVQDVLRTFRSEHDVWMWDLYNEPGNSGYGEKSLELLRDVFQWAREVGPSQPLTAAAFSGGNDKVDQTCLELSDVVTFHSYDGVEELEKQIAFYRSSGRPVVCSEWMARPNGSRILTHLPVFRSQNVSCLQWGFVSGKTNTIFPWGSEEGSPEPKVWFHDLYRRDGTPFDPAEIALYQELTSLPLKSLSLADKLPIVNNPQGITGLRLLADMPLRDPSVCRGPDGTWYLTGTVEPFYGFNEGIKMWSSRDLAQWKPMGFVWKYGDSPWHKPYLEKKMSLWAPEVHYLKGTFWLTYSMPGYGGSGMTSGSGLLMSKTGEAEGPYLDMCPEHRLGDEIDGSLFQDDDGSMYYVWHSGKIAKMTADVSHFDEPYHWLRTSATDPDPNHHSELCPGIFGKDSFDHVGFEGAYLFKRNGTYYLTCAEMYDGRYSTMVATSKNIYGPYSPRYEAVPHGGHTVFFQDEQGRWWSTIFGSDDGAPWQQKPGIVPIRFDEAGKLLLDNR
jgi:hypothetical protein